MKSIKQNVTYEQMIAYSTDQNYSGSKNYPSTPYSLFISSFFNL